MALGWSLEEHHKTVGVHKYVFQINKTLILTNNQFAILCIERPGSADDITLLDSTWIGKNVLTHRTRERGKGGTRYQPWENKDYNGRKTKESRQVRDQEQTGWVHG